MSRECPSMVGGRRAWRCGRPSARSASAGRRQAAQERRGDSARRRRVTETGSTLLYPLLNLWVGGYSTEVPQVTIQTAGTGSGTGISDATNGTADIGASDAYLSPSDVRPTPTLKNIPLAISAQLVAYNVPGVTAHLKLTGKVLSADLPGQDHQLERPGDHRPQPGRDPAEHPDRDPAPLRQQR